MLVRGQSEYGIPPPVIYLNTHRSSLNLAVLNKYESNLILIQNTPSVMQLCNIVIHS